MLQEALRDVLQMMHVLSTVQWVSSPRHALKVPTFRWAGRYKHVPGVIHIKQGSLLLRHRPWHNMLRSSMTDHSMMHISCIQEIEDRKVPLVLS